MSDDGMHKDPDGKKLEEVFDKAETDRIKRAVAALKKAGDKSGIALFGAQCYMNGMTDGMNGKKLAEETA